MPHSRAEFYSESTKILLESWDESKEQSPNRYKGFSKRLILQHLALHAQDSIQVQQQDRKTLNFQTVVEEIRSVLPGLNLDAEQDWQPLLDEIVERSGLLLRIDGGARYQFSHLTLQEYFAAAALVDKPQEIIERFTENPDDWREVVKLWCGLANDSTDMVRAIYPNEVVTNEEVQRAALALECIASAQQIDESLANEIIDKLKARLANRRGLFQGRNVRNESIQEAFGSIAADPRPRGQKTFEYLITVFKQVFNPEQRSGGEEQKSCAAIAISHSNRPDAAQQLLLGSPNIPDVRAMIIRLGDLAVPSLEQCLEGSDLVFVKSALSDLHQIGTPEAAKALVPSLWHSEIQVSCVAAWYLASLLIQAEVEETLDDPALIPANANGESHDWVWEPFLSGETKGIKHIVGRISFLLGNTPTEAIPHTLLRVDLRVMLPVCAIIAQPILKSKKWNSDADSLLIGKQSEQVLTRKVDEILSKDISTTTEWRINLLSRIPGQLQLKLLKGLISSERKCNQEDWLNIYRRLKFNFAKSWQYNFIIFISFTSSVGAIAQSLYLPFQNKSVWANWLFGLPVVVMIYFWIFIWQGIESSGEAPKHIAPSLFLKFGIFGWREFWREQKSLMHNQVTGTDISSFYKISTNSKIIVGAIICISTLFSPNANDVYIYSAACSVVSGAALGIAFGAAAVTLAVSVNFDNALTNLFLALLNNRNRWLTFAVIVSASLGPAGIWAELYNPDSIALTVALTATGSSFIAGFVIGAGVGFWHQSELESTTKFRVGAIVAYPFFCVAPCILFYSALGLHNFFSWPQIVAIQLSLIILCAVLWHWGQYLERAASNPLQGILGENFEDQAWRNM